MVCDSLIDAYFQCEWTYNAGDMTLQEDNSRTCYSDT